jgi:hypothetical protein
MNMIEKRDFLLRPEHFLRPPHLNFSVPRHVPVWYGDAGRSGRLKYRLHATMVANNGEVFIRPSIAMQTVAVNVIWPID